MKIANVVTMFADKSYNAKRNAQANLAGRTHWADDDTLKFFGCKINSANDGADGKLFDVKYTQQAGFNPADGRVFGSIVFDLWGNCVVDRKFATARKRDKWHCATVKQCETHVDLITDTGRVARIAQLMREVNALEECVE